jgi:hypothetical protein
MHLCLFLKCIIILIIYLSHMSRLFVISMKKHATKAVFIVCILACPIFIGVAQAAYNPVLTNIELNGGNDITLNPGGNVSVSATALVTDQDGSADLDTATAKIYRSGVTNAENCTANINNCYESTCSLSSCLGNTCSVTCSISMSFVADPTVSGGVYVDEYWRVYLHVHDKTGGSTSDYSIINSPDVTSTLAIAITPASIDYGTVNPSTDTGIVNKTIALNNTGNTPSAIQLSGTNACLDTDPTCSLGVNATLLPSRQKYLASAFTYSNTTPPTAGMPLSTTASGYAGINLLKPTQSPSNSSGTLYWGLGVPQPQYAGNYSSTITITAITSLGTGYSQCTTSANCGGAACTTFYWDGDADGLGMNAYSIRACGTTPPIAYATDNTDTNKDIYCPNSSYNPPGTCAKCVNGDIVIQTNSEDLFGECNPGNDGSSTSCRANLCSGTSKGCSVLALGTVCRSAKTVCDVVEVCDGDKDSCVIDAFQSSNTNISSSTTCQECSGTDNVLITQSSAEDRWGQCTNGGTSGGTDSCKSNNCDGTINACGTLPSSTVCRTSAGVCDIDDYCSGTIYNCNSDTKLSGKQACTTCMTCNGTLNTCQNVSGGTDPNGDCAAYGCSSYIWGWGASFPNSCRVASTDILKDGMCDGAAACYSSTITNQCIEDSQSGTAVCGSAGCKKACTQNTTPTTTYDTIAEACFTSGENGCGTGNECDASGTCIALPAPCGSSFTITHTAGTVAPVTKTVTYETVLSSITGSPKCWITQNLGATHHAATVDESTEPNAGWYWQFNSPRGYQYTTVRTPSTAWISSISQSSDWVIGNDPCNILLGNGWRLPNSTEWTAVNASGPWITWTDAFNSDLIIHAAGYLNPADGVLTNRGVGGSNWSSTRMSNLSGWGITIYSYNTYISGGAKSFGCSLRCLRD